MTWKPDQRVDIESDEFMNGLGRALAYAAFHRVDTALITSPGEPLLDIEAVCRVAQGAKINGIPIIEVQTNGTRLLENEYVNDSMLVFDILHMNHVNTVAISAAAMDSVHSSTIMGLPEDYDYLEAAQAVVDAGLLCRITLNLTRDFDLTHFDDYVDLLRRLGIHQLTLRELGTAETPGKTSAAAEKVCDWVRNNKLEDSFEMTLIERVHGRGVPLRELPHGGWVHDYRGLAVVTATCMEALPTDLRDGRVRSLILQPDGGLYHSWQHRGSRIL
jgi:hypothetical protein